MTDINEELMDLDMEPKPGSLLCTSTYKDEEQRENWETPFVEVFDLLGSRFSWTGKWLQGTEKDIQRWVHLQRKECVSLRAKCDRMVSDAFSTGVNGNPEIDLQNKNESRRRSGRLQEEDVVGDEATCTKMILPTMAETCLEGVDHGLGFLRQRLSFHKRGTIDSEVADYGLVEGQVCLDHACGSDKCLAVKHKKGFHNRGVVWNSCMAKLAGEGKDGTRDDDGPAHEE